jgi:hypothetical protein
MTGAAGFLNRRDGPDLPRIAEIGLEQGIQFLPA